MSDMFYQSLDPAGAPEPVTPAASPADDSGWGMVTPDGQGPAPYNIQAPTDEAAIQAAYDGAGVSAAGVVVYPHQGPRQAATEVLLSSPAGFSAGSGTSGYDITQGWSGEPDESFVNNAQPTEILQTPIQGTGDYPGTTQDGLQKYGTS